MAWKNSELMPNFPPEGMGPTGVPMDRAVPGKRKKKTSGLPYVFPFPAVTPND